MEQQLEDIAARLGIRIVYMNETTSTNDVAGRGGLAHGDMVVAEKQSAGRGQRGNRWESAAGKNLLFSVVLRPTFLPVSHQFLLSEAVSLAVVATLAAFGIEAKIKWPNDIYIGDGKVAGILIENDIKGGTLWQSVAGIGLNVNQEEFDASLPNPVSMRMQAGGEFDRAALLERFAEELQKRYAMLKDGFTDDIESNYHRHLYRKTGAPVPFTLPSGEPFAAVILRVRPNGELMLGHSDGTMKGYLFKEVEYVR